MKPQSYTTDQLKDEYNAIKGKVPEPKSRQVWGDKLRDPKIFRLELRQGILKDHARRMAKQKAIKSRS